MKKTKPAVSTPPRKDATPRQDTIALTRSTAPRKGSSVVYTLDSRRGTVKFARSLFGAEPPATLAIEGNGFAAPAMKMTKEERAAERAKLTPADKARIARERATKAAARAARLEAAAATV